jgi:hypothetical protein
MLHDLNRIEHRLGSGRRSPAVWARHHWDFARGSQQFYCEYKKLGVLSPRRWLSAPLPCFCNTGCCDGM